MGHGDVPSTPALPRQVRDALDPGVARAWRLLADHLPDGLYLAGGSAVGVRLRHRRSDDLDFFFHADRIDLDALETTLTPLGFVTTLREPGTLRMRLEKTKIEFLHADQGRRQQQLAPPDEIARIPVAALEDLMATKLKVLGERGELRDYFDVMKLETLGGIPIEQGLYLYLRRYGLDAASGQLHHLVRAMGYLDDAPDDDNVPMSRAALIAWWRERQVRLLREGF